MLPSQQGGESSTGIAVRALHEFLTVNLPAMVLAAIIGLPLAWLAAMGAVMAVVITSDWISLGVFP